MGGVSAQGGSKNTHTLTFGYVESASTLAGIGRLDKMEESCYDYKRYYITIRSNRPIIHRAAKHLLRMSLEDKVMPALAPPGYRKSREIYNEHPAQIVISELLGNILTRQGEEESIPEENMLTDSDEENHERDEDSKSRTRKNLMLLLRVSEKNSGSKRTTDGNIWLLGSK